MSPVTPVAAFEMKAVKTAKLTASQIIFWIALAWRRDRFKLSRKKPNQPMKKLSIYLALAVCGLSLAATQLTAAEAKTYQVTGPVLEVNDSCIVVQKGEEKWQLACDKATAGKVKVGDKVTVQYQMVAKDVEVKADKAVP
jgi:hypothetical protein